MGNTNEICDLDLERRQVRPNGCQPARLHGRHDRGYVGLRRHRRGQVKPRPRGSHLTSIGALDSPSRNPEEEPIPARHLVVIGAGGHAVSLTETIEAMGMRVSAYVDERVQDESTFLGSPLVPKIPEAWAEAELSLVVAIGDNFTRQQVAKAIAQNYQNHQLATLVHPSASVARSAQLGPGTVVLQGAVVGSHARVAEGGLINSGAIVEHECELGDYASIGPGAVLGGRTTVGSRTAVSIGAAVKHGIHIGDDTVVGAASFVHQDLPGKVVAYGTPAVIKRPRNPSDAYLV